MDTPEASPRKSTEGPLPCPLSLFFSLAISLRTESESAMEGEDLVTCVVTEVEKKIYVVKRTRERRRRRKEDREVVSLMVERRASA